MIVAAVTVGRIYGFILILPSGFNVNLPAEQLKQLFAFMVYNCVPANRYSLLQNLTWQLHDSIENARLNFNISGISDQLIKIVQSHNQQLSRTSVITNSHIKKRLYVTQREITYQIEGQRQTRYILILFKLHSDDSYHANIYHSKYHLDNKIIRTLIVEYLTDNYPIDSSFNLVTDKMAIVMESHTISIRLEYIGVKVGRNVSFKMIYATKWNTKARKEITDIINYIEYNYTDQPTGLIKLIRTDDSDDYRLVRTADTDLISKITEIVPQLSDQVTGEKTGNSSDMSS